MATLTIINSAKSWVDISIGRVGRSSAEHANRRPTSGGAGAAWSIITTYGTQVGTRRKSLSEILYECYEPPSTITFMRELAFHTSSSADWVGRSIALIGLLISLLSVAVTRRLWMRSGWRLQLSYEWLAAPGREKDFNVVITNVGRTPCVVSDVGARIWDRFVTDFVEIHAQDGIRKVVEPSERIAVTLDFPENLRHQPTVTQLFAITGGELWLGKMSGPGKLRLKRT